MSQKNYASFNQRFVASLIDGVVFLLLIYLTLGKQEINENTSVKSSVFLVLNTVLGWLYFAILESSQIQGTLGKQIVGISVTDLRGNKISFGKATARYFGKSFFLVVWIAATIVAIMGEGTGSTDSPYLILAGILFILGLIVLVVGYLMAAFTPEKQALHDIMARCLVERASGQPRAIPWKSLVALAIAGFFSSKILAMIPEAPNDPNNDTISEPTPTETSPPTRPRTKYPKVSTKENRIFGPLIEPDDRLKEAFKGVWKLSYSVGFVVHESQLSMTGPSGVMFTQFFDSDINQTKTILQKIELLSSAKGLVLLGSDPTNLDSGEIDSAYSADNFRVAQRPDGTFEFRNYSLSDDGSIFESPVEAEFSGYPKLGVQMAELTREVKQKLNTEIGSNVITEEQGVLVIKVFDDSPAEKANIRPGDVLQEVKNRTVTSPSQVQEIVQSSYLFLPIDIQLNRSGENINLSVQPECCMTQEE
ncbi:MAG: RDD family protein [Trichodesmium sp. St19_bin2]|nr:RDD family protein [Trichodesmium sp. St18_bin3_1_1]MDE5101608.1 RDD family protein [Trichodesmium sp. St19_bin2]